MSERNKRHEEAFKEAEQEWDLPRLYADLESVKQRDSSHNTRRKYLTPVEKCHLRGLLCFKTTKQIADARGRDEGTVKENISETLFNYIELLIKEKLNETFIRRWDCVSLYLEKAGYKEELREHPGARISETNLPSVAVTEQPQQNQAICPYLGLSAFREKDAAYFFGREKFTDELSKTVTEKPLFAVIGASGSGKSSVVFAGLIPRLRREKNWVIVSCRLGNRPFNSLSAALIPEMKLQISAIEQLSEVKKLAEKFRQGESGLQDVVELILQKNSDACRLLLVIDQFEELYTLCKSAEERQRFLDELLTAVHVASHQRTPNLTLVITLRGDFYGYALSNRLFSDALQGAIANISSMSRQELKDAIEKPAAQASLQFEDGLTQTILKDVSKAPGNLPLLEFTLTQLWEKRRDDKLTHSIYEEIGGVEQALAKYAEEVYCKLNEDEQKRAKQIFIQLVHPGKGTADTRRLATRPQVGEDNWDLVTSLADARLVVSNRDEATGEETVEVVHEALIEGWQRLREWIESEREFRTWQERLRFRMAQWKVSGKDKGELLRGAPLVEAEKWLEEQHHRIPEDEQAFIQASRERQTQEEQQWQKLYAKSEQERKRAEIGEVNATLRALSASSRELYDSGKRFDALMESLRAGRLLKQKFDLVKPDIRIQVVTGLLDAVDSVIERNRFEGHGDSVNCVSFSPNGELIASASADKTVKLWRSDGTFLKPLEGHSDSVNSVNFSPDGELVASASADKTVKLWRSDGSCQTLEGHRDSVNSVSFSPDGELVASASADKTVKLWRSNGSCQTLQGHRDSVNSVSFSPDGELIASASEDGTVKLWNLNGSELITLEHNNEVSSEKLNPTGLYRELSSADEIGKKTNPDQVTSVSFSPDGKLIATASKVSYQFGSMFRLSRKLFDTVKLWSRDGTLLRTLQGHSPVVDSVSFSPDGHLIALASGSVVELWTYNYVVFKEGPFARLESNGVNHLRTFEGHRYSIFEVSFSPDSKTLASAGRDGTVKLWGIKVRAGIGFWEARRTKFEGHIDSASSVSFSPDSKTLVSGSSTVTLWHSNGKLLKTLEGSSGSFSPDGHKIVTITDNTLKLWSHNGTLLKRLIGHSDYVRSASFSPDSQIVASASADKTVKLWRVDGTLLKTLDLDVSGVSFSPDGHLLTSASNEIAIKLWDCSGELIRIFDFSEMNFSLDSQKIATIDDDTLKLWHCINTFRKTLGGCSSMSLSPDGQIIATIDNYDIIKLWYRDGTLLTTLEAHKSSVFDVSFSPDGQILASSSSDQTVKLWSIDGTLVKSFETALIFQLSFSPDGKTLLLKGWNHCPTLELWNLDLDDLLVRGCNWLRDYLKTNPNVSESDRHLCDGIGTQK
jgi:WD40 repeat protein